MTSGVSAAVNGHTARFRAFDGLRGIAALLVVLLHVQWPNHITGLQFVKNGYLAVDLFFILSGLVISSKYSTLLVNGRAVWRFIVLRFFRVYPLHFAMLAAFISVECVKLGARHWFGILPEHPPFTEGQSAVSVVTHLFLVQGLGLLPTPGWNGPSWSISCEFVVYVVFAAATVLGLAKSRTCLVVGALITAVVYAALAFTRGTLDVVYDFGILRCLAGFYWGMLIHRWAVGATKHITRPHAFEGATAFAVIATMATMSGAWIAIVIPLFICLLTLLRSDSGPVARMLLARPVQYLGEISYSVYLVHQLVIVCVLMALKRLAPIAHDPIMHMDLVAINPWVGDALVLGVVGAVILIASRTYALIETPARLFGKHVLRGSWENSCFGKATTPLIGVRATLGRTLMRPE